MKLWTTTTLALAATIVSRLKASIAFSTTRFFSTTARCRTPSFAICHPPTQLHLDGKIHSIESDRRKIRSKVTGLNMIFGNLFRGLSDGGGAFGLQIDYAELDYPGPELAKFAEAGIVPTKSEKDPTLSIATFAGGCFWGLELAYQRIPGVTVTAVGYTQGREEKPNYDQVCASATGHTEAVIVYYDPNDVSYERLLNVFFERVDPTTVGGQGRDYGKQYRTGVYYHTPEQEEIARIRFEKEKEKYPRKPIATELKPAKLFWPAEKYHQQYLEKGGRFGDPQSATKGAEDEIRCYG